MALRDYKSKRSFDKTAEPEGKVHADRRGHAPIFVVQLHHARARHYDFRLEHEGVLKSWAVPKGPSLRVGEKRLAVEVEDHPIEYATFEGTIPAGEYGAGDVRIFDHGTWEGEGDVSAALHKGHLDFTLHGDLLVGRWMLIRTGMRGKKPQWLLIKHTDEFARDVDADDLLEAPPKRSRPAASPRTAATVAKPAKRKTPAARKAAPRARSWRKQAAALPGATTGTVDAGFRPELCSLRPAPPAGDAWIHEVKWDGYRLLVSIDHGKPRLRSRNDLDWTDGFPHIVQALSELELASVRMDGELIALDARGLSDFGLLQHALSSASPSPATRSSAKGDRQTLKVALFDLLEVDGIVLTSTPLIERKRLLEAILSAHPSDVLLYSSHVTGHGPEVFDASRRRGLEGIVSKRAMSAYSGVRSGDWVKVKHALGDEFIVVGYTLPKGARDGFGALLLATVEAGSLKYVGRVGTGFDDNLLKSLRKTLAPLERSAPTVVLPSHLPGSSKQIRWVAPSVVVEVTFRGWGKEGLLRHSSFLRLRPDKSLEDFSMPTQATVTHAERVVYPKDGITKGEVAAYYRAVAPLMLPELQGRPLSIVRCPAGLAGDCFFQKHHASTLGTHVLSVDVKEKAGDHEAYLYVDSAAGIDELVQMNGLEFHPWGSRVDAPDQPDRLVFDLDPAEDIAWKTVVEAGREVRARLSDAGLQSWVRLSGGKGLHVVVPIDRGPSWAEVKHFCDAFAEALATHRPDRYVATSSKKLRGGHIFVDWLRNARGATSVASWSLRARDGAPVAMPLRWEELGRVTSPAMYDMHKALRRAATLPADPWEDIARTRQQLPGHATPVAASRARHA